MTKSKARLSRPQKSESVVAAEKAGHPNPWDKPLSYKPSEFSALVEAHQLAMAEASVDGPLPGPAPTAAVYEGLIYDIDEFEKRLRTKIRHLAQTDAWRRKTYGDQLYPVNKSERRWLSDLIDSSTYGL